MATKVNFYENYGDKSARERAELIYSNYSSFQGIIEDCKMTCKDKEPISVITSYAEAACDFMGRKRTQDLVARGLSCVDKLPESKDWYIPAIGELYVMYLMKNQINKALEYIGAELIKDTWYWSSTENSATGAWGLLFGTGDFYYYGKTREYSVRPVSAFNHLTL